MARRNYDDGLIAQHSPDLTDDWLDEGPLKTVADAVVLLLATVLAGVLAMAITIAIIAPLYFLPQIVVSLLWETGMGHSKKELLQVIGLTLGVGFDTGVLVYLME